MRRLHLLKEDHMRIMERLDDMQGSLSRIEKKVDGYGNLEERVLNLERWQAWLKGGCAALAAAWAYLCKATYGK